MSAPLVAFVTDFGRADSYVAEMHAAVLRRVPGARILDVSHDVPPFDRVAAALVLERALAQLPRGAALVAVVDPGVGTARGRVFVRAEARGVFLVGPDNGLLPRGPGDAVWTIRAEVLAPRGGVTTFDGREVFAPLGALLAAGLAPELAGARCDDLTPHVLPADAEFDLAAGGRYARGVVVALDRYGNAVTNVRARGGVSPACHAVLEPARFAGPLRTAYGAVPAGAPLALVGSSGRIELAVREGASGLRAGDAVVVRCVD